MDVDIMESELRTFWYLSQEASKVRASGDLTNPELRWVRDEAESIVMHTDWPRMRAIGRKRIDDHDKAVMKYLLSKVA